ncbi:MAG: OsmC family protein [Acidimicrobiales bacterium]
MDQEALSKIQGPLKEAYKQDPGGAKITLSATGRVGEGVTCSVPTGQALVQAGLHPATGGDGLSACSGDMLLQALVACAGVTLGAVATSLGIEVGDASLTAEGDLDFRGTLSVAKEAPVGFSAIRLRVDLAEEVSEEQRALLAKLTERFCVVFQTLAAPPAMSVSFG